MVHDLEFSFLLFYAIFLTARAHYDPLSDNVAFSLNFPGPLTETDSELSLSTSDGLHDENTVVVVTENKERYKCVIPSVTGDQDNQDGKKYTGPSEGTLLSPMFEQSSCSYKIEPYWTYELCHAKYLRQYHEEKDAGKDVKLQEYYLGNNRKSGKEASSSTTEKTVSEEVDADKSDESKVVQVGGLNFPYYEVNLTDGTPCDLTKHPRKTSVKYICHELGRGEIFELKETSTCEYEVIILTQLLCSHPLYQPHKDPVNKILCHALDNSPTQPSSLVNFELENSQGRYNKKDYFEPGDATIKIMIGPDGIVEEQIKTDSSKQTVKDSSSSSTSQKGAPQKQVGVRSDKQLLRDFLAGDYCIQGGAGWWKHELCYGKAVTQFHEERTGKTVITLGRWNEEKHMEWIKSNPLKKNNKEDKDKKVLHHYYGGGDVCDETGKPRLTEVKLRCKENPTHPNSMAIFLVEPKICEYTLVVESQVFCSLIEQADENGIIISPET